MAGRSAIKKSVPRAVKRHGEPLILAVDNALMFLNTLKRLLEGHPYALHCTTSCSEAVEYAKMNRPDIVLLDVEMPEMNGYEVLKKLKGEERTADIPVIFLTAKVDPESEAKGRKMGAIDYITKPFSGEQLLKRIEKIFF